ncbi:hypothetical protein RX327_02280 [Bradyrhizobium sp. BEA-2-5]|uniref:hypothetical protein n=1 Tax=Bradyrhizobium TaxID=374 RepID=UPI00067D0782|nr:MULTISPECIES: hypothetical protein [Bradyrhizobium]WOH82054.1 hypothetical protein RX327_02280 [Bradyrhizobium sp. BEA-2-5]
MENLGADPVGRATGEFAIIEPFVDARILQKHARLLRAASLDSASAIRFGMLGRGPIKAQP